MKKHLYFLLLVLLIDIEHQTLAKTQSSSDAYQNYSVNDEEITKQVKNLLDKEKDIPKTHIKIITKNGIVGIYGSVDTRLQANRITEIVSSITNVIDVNTENLKIKSSKEFLSDAYITAKAKGKIKFLSVSHQIKPGYELHLETTNGIVHIFGRVTDHADIKTIKNSVLSIIDVQHVKMNVKCN